MCKISRRYCHHRRTKDNGQSWEQINSFNWEYLELGEGIEETADAVVVADDSGTLYATFMRDWNITFKSSSDGGKSWTEPICVSGELQSDKNWMSISPSNPNTIFVTFNSKWPYEVHSTDNGLSWTAPNKLDESDGNYFFACGSVVRSDGTAFIAYAAVLDEEAPGPYTYAKVYSSSDNFATFTTHTIDYWAGYQACPDWADCGTDYLNGGCSMSIDGADNVYYTYNAYADHGVDHGNMQVFLTYMQASATEFSTPVAVSDAPVSSELVYVSFPLVAGGSKNGDVRVAWMDNRTGMWNLFYRDSSDFFATSAASTRLSYYDKFTFQSTDGFVFPYGDYGSMQVDADDNTHVVWGEGLGHYAGGSVMYATSAPFKKHSEDNDASSALTQNQALLVTGVASFLGGAILAGSISYFLLASSLCKHDSAQDKKNLV
jgi:hypothetical protein